MKNFLNKKINRATYLLVVFSIFLTSLFGFNYAHAQFSGTEISFGGLNTVFIPCTCSGGFLLYIFDYKTNTVLPLVYQAGVSFLYEYYNIFGRYLLGSYIPGAGQCLIYAGTSCTTVPSVGMLGFQPGTGTSGF